MKYLTPLALLPLLPMLVSAQQQPGSFSMNASIPSMADSLSGCVILAQLTPAPLSIQAMKPICPSTTFNPTDPSTGVTLDWPFSENGTGVSSSLAIYGQIKHEEERTDLYMAKSGCVLLLDTTQAQYLLGRSLTWNNNLQELRDNTANGFVSDKNGMALTCGQNETILPKDLFLPEPYIATFDDPVWNVPIDLAGPQYVDHRISSSSDAGTVQTGSSSETGATATANTNTATEATAATSKSDSDSTASPTTATATKEAVTTSVSSSSTMDMTTNTGMDMGMGTTTDFSSSTSTSAIGQGLVGTTGDTTTGTGSSTTTKSTGTDVVAVQTSVSASDTADGDCQRVTVTEVWTTTVTAQPQTKRWSPRGYPPLRGSN